MSCKQVSYFDRYGVGFPVNLQLEGAVVLELGGASCQEEVKRGRGEYQVSLHFKNYYRTFS